MLNEIEKALEALTDAVAARALLGGIEPLITIGSYRIRTTPAGEIVAVERR